MRGDGDPLKNCKLDFNDCAGSGIGHGMVVWMYGLGRGKKVHQGIKREQKG